MKPGQIGRSQNERFRSCPSTAVTTQRRPSSMHRRQRLALIRSESAFYTRQAHRARLWPLRDVRFRPCLRAFSAPSRPRGCWRGLLHAGAPSRYAPAALSTGETGSWRRGLGFNVVRLRPFPQRWVLGYTISPALPDRRAWRLHALERRPISCPALALRGFQRAPACVMTPWPRCAASRTYPF